MIPRWLTSLCSFQISFGFALVKMLKHNQQKDSTKGTSVSTTIYRAPAVLISTKICFSLCILYFLYTTTTEYASCTQQPPENAQQGNSTEPPAYEFLTGWQMGVRDSQPQPAVKDTSSKCWLAVGILISIVFIPLSALGVMGYQAIEAANEAKSGNAAEYKKKICRSKAYGLTGIGLLLLLITIITAASRNLLEALPVNLMFPLHPIIFIWDALRITNLEILMVMNIILEMIFLLRIVPTTAPKEVYKYAGLQNGFFCSCGTSYGSYGELDQDECSSVCSADGMECGGLYSNSIYRTNYIGCYKDYNETFDYILICQMMRLPE
ncbi:LIPI [Bugula neritina]|uniref:LIPI n=1 Tax=Bugula neritina TaxID=10212 RepID=A0A7J7KLR5_BUGNE|nr:LIPI [Bugula neritina]